MKKRIASLLMVAAMLLSLAANALAVDVPQPTAQGEAAVSQFQDVSTTYWAYSGIRDVVSRGLYQGTSQTTFEPDKNMSRAQFVIVLARFDGRGSLENQRAATGFSDVPEDFWAAGAIAWAASSNIVLGYGGENGTNVFYPNRTISRAQIAALVYRYLNYKGYNLPAVASPVAPFTDMGIVPDVFREAVDYCRTRDLLRGYEDGSLRPNNNVTRAQVATILSRMISVLENVDVTPTPSDGTVNLSASSYQNGTTTWREENGNIYLTVTPNAGYIVESVTAVDAQGNRLAVTRLPNGEYMFAKPTALPVTVTVVYDIDTTAYYSFTEQSNTNGNSSRVTLVERGAGSRWEEVARRDSDGHLTFVNGYSGIQVGDRLTVSHIANDGYRFNSIKITNSNGRNVAADRRNNDTTRFTLPSATPVLIDVEYRTGTSRGGGGGGSSSGGGGGWLPTNTPTPPAEADTVNVTLRTNGAGIVSANSQDYSSGTKTGLSSESTFTAHAGEQIQVSAKAYTKGGWTLPAYNVFMVNMEDPENPIDMDDVSSVENGNFYWTIPETAASDAEYGIAITFVYTPTENKNGIIRLFDAEGNAIGDVEGLPEFTAEGITFTRNANDYTSSRTLAQDDDNLAVAVTPNSAATLAIDLKNDLYKSDSTEDIFPADFMAEWAYAAANPSFLFAYYAVEDADGNYVVPVTVTMSGAQPTPTAEPTTTPTTEPTATPTEQPPAESATYDIVFAKSDDPAVNVDYTFNVTFADGQTPDNGVTRMSTDANGVYSVPVTTANPDHKPSGIQITNVDVTGLNSNDGTYRLESITHNNTEYGRNTEGVFDFIPLTFVQESADHFVATLTPTVKDMTGKYSVSVIGLVFAGTSSDATTAANPPMIFTLTAGDVTANYDANGLTPNEFELGKTLSISGAQALTPYQLWNTAPENWQSYVNATLGAKAESAYAKIFAISNDGTVANLENSTTIDKAFLGEDSTELTVYVVLQPVTHTISTEARAYTDSSITNPGTMSIYVGPFESDDPDTWTSAPASFTANEETVVRVLASPADDMKIDSFKFEDANGNDITDIAADDPVVLSDNSGRKYIQFTYYGDRDIKVVGLFSKANELIFTLKAEGEGDGMFDAKVTSRSLRFNGSSVRGNSADVSYANGRFSSEYATIDSAGNAMFVMIAPDTARRTYRDIVTVELIEQAKYDTTLSEVKAEDITGEDVFTLSESALATNADTADKFEYRVASDKTYEIAWPSGNVDMTVHYTVKQFVYALALDAQVGNLGLASGKYNAGTPFITTGLIDGTDDYNGEGGADKEYVTFQQALDSLFETTDDPDPDFKTSDTEPNYQDGIKTLENYLDQVKLRLDEYSKDNKLEITNKTLVKAGINNEVQNKVEAQVDDLQNQMNALVQDGTEGLYESAKTSVESVIIERLKANSDLKAIYDAYKDAVAAQQTAAAAGQTAEIPAELQDSYDSLLKYLYEDDKGTLTVQWDKVDKDSDLEISIEGMTELVEEIKDYAINNYKVVDPAQLVLRDSDVGVDGKVVDSKQDAVIDYIADESKQAPDLEFKVSVYGDVEDSSVSVTDPNAGGFAYLAAQTTEQQVALSVNINRTGDKALTVVFNGSLGFSLVPVNPDGSKGAAVSAIKDASGKETKLEVAFRNEERPIEVTAKDVRVVKLSNMYVDIGQIMTTKQLDSLDNRVKNRYPTPITPDVQSAFDAIYVPQGQNSTADNSLVVADIGDKVDEKYSALNGFTVNGSDVVKLISGSSTTTNYAEASKLQIDLLPDTWTPIFHTGIDKAFDLKAAMTRYYNKDYTDWMVGRLDYFGIDTKNIGSNNDIAAALKGTVDNNGYKDLYLKDVFREMYNFDGKGDVDPDVFTANRWTGYDQQVELTWSKEFETKTDESSTDEQSSQIGTILQGVFGNPDDDSVSVTGKLIIARKELTE